MANKEQNSLARAIFDGLDVGKIFAGSPEIGVGKKAILLIDLSVGQNKMRVELYSEILLPSKPDDELVGFETKDLKRQHGVVASTIYGKKNGKEIKEGKYYTVEEFISVTEGSEAFRKKVMNKLEVLDEYASIDDDDLSQYSMFWMNREPGKETIGKPKFWC